MPDLTKLVEELERSFKEAQERMSDPAVYNDRREAEEVGKRLKKLETPFRLAEQWRQARDDLAAAKADPELAEMAPDYEADVARLEDELKLSLEPRDVGLEVRRHLGELGVGLRGRQVVARLTPLFGKPEGRLELLQPLADLLRFAAVVVDGRI